MRVLVADDNALAREALVRVLKHAGMDVDEVEGGEKCVELFTSTSYDLVISDLDMPDMNGVEVAKRIRQLDSQAEIYAFSGSSGTTLMQEAKDIFSRVFRKPDEVGMLITQARAYGDSLIKQY